MSGWPTQLPDSSKLSTADLLIDLVVTLVEPVTLLAMFEVVSRDVVARAFKSRTAGA